MGLGTLGLPASEGTFRLLADRLALCHRCHLETCELLMFCEHVWDLTPAETGEAEASTVCRVLDLCGWDMDWAARACRVWKRVPDVAFEVCWTAIRRARDPTGQLSQVDAAVMLIEGRRRRRAKYILFLLNIKKRGSRLDGAANSSFVT